MTDMEILTLIARDVADISNCMHGASKTEKAIWLTKELFNRLFPEHFNILPKEASPFLFGCRVRVMLFPYEGLYWIVGYEGEIQEV